ncbi:hypothetical protein K458DRAFT_382964 [Lentithecium fluviatile CBS 122367]|uniref:Uncharacterized protein n=1 Tax=Lentithecium fluviatile CBS 122367 TaxID=1168545 RepID=A0A6G1JGZ0_9PLEO|nr:hypothetical protein K458DRAFT_382964 [Lentithecium fluviatile CBS 122367]
MSDCAESSTAAMLLRCDDRMTIELRSDRALELEDIIRLQRAASPIHDVSSTIGTPTTAGLRSSRKESSDTKPTSGGTGYPVHDYKGKGKAVAMYESSLSATHGSGSDAEAEQENALVGIGDWTADGPITGRPLKGAARARRRPRANRRPKSKKPVIIIQHDVPDHASSGEDENPAATQVAVGNSKVEPKCLIRRRSVKSVRSDQNRLALAEEGRVSQVVEGDKAACSRLSPVRLYVLIAILVAIGLTLALSTFAARYTASHNVGKSRIACTKAVIFAATVVISGFSVLAMVVARRALQEALLAGLLQCLVGFALVIEIHDWM